MAENLMGVCQVCGRRVEFPSEHSGQSATCPHCGRTTRLKPAPVELLEAAPPEPGAPSPSPALQPASSSAPEPDPVQRRLRRSYLKLLVLTVILVALLVGLVWIAEWLHTLALQR
ncbi:MAG: hypothetical protein N3J91_01615 [Verrucomicrobiae bacterium]|nr:hypothetical protein [Verrucomicrobiae bacterium]